MEMGVGSDEEQELGLNDQREYISASQIHNPVSALGHFMSLDDEVA